jgi:hypothetical protein
MKRLLLLLIITSLFTVKGFAQVDDSTQTETETKSEEIERVVYEITKLDSLKTINTVKTKMDNFLSNLTTISFKDNRKDMYLEPNLRYFVYELNSYNLKDSICRKAVDNLSQYIKNDSLRRMSRYIINYIPTTRVNKKSLDILNEYIYNDSLRCSASILIADELTRDSIENDIEKNKELRRLHQFLTNSKEYDLIKKASRDSVKVTFKNFSNDRISMWVNNSRNESYRFKIKTKENNPIGTWIQTTKDKCIKLLVDDDVYQKSEAENPFILKQPPIIVIDTSLNKVEDLYNYQRSYMKWKYGNKIYLGLTQGKLANWKDGGESSVATQVDINSFFNYKFRNVIWENLIKYRIAFMQSGDAQTKKTEDNFEFNTQFGYKFYKKWYFSTLFNFKTQLFDGYNYKNDNTKTLISRFMGPGYFIASIGLDYKPSDKTSVMFSPFTGKITAVVNDEDIDVTQYNIEKGSHTKQELGSYLKILLKRTLFENVNIENELSSFYNYDVPLNETDFDLKTTIEMKINYFLTTRIYTELKFDKNISKKLQFKEIFNIGITYNF